jgi:hypothetical protein
MRASRGQFQMRLILVHPLLTLIPPSQPPKCISLRRLAPQTEK